LEIKVGFYEDDKFKTDDVYSVDFSQEFLDLVEEKEGLTKKDFYSWFISNDEVKSWLSENFKDKVVGILEIGDRDYKMFWFFKPYYVKHMEFFTNYFGIYFDEEYMNESDLADDILEYLKDELELMKIDLQSLQDEQ
jgi:hypothetical protein